MTKQFDPIVSLVTIVFGCSGGNDGNVRAMATTSSLVAALMRHNNQITWGGNQWGDGVDGDE